MGQGFGDYPTYAAPRVSPSWDGCTLCGSIIIKVTAAHLQIEPKITPLVPVVGKVLKTQPTSFGPEDKTRWHLLTRICISSWMLSPAEGCSAPAQGSSLLDLAASCFVVLLLGLGCCFFFLVFWFLF